MEDGGSNISMLFTALGVVALGLVMMFVFIPQVTKIILERRARTPEIKSPLDGMILSPIYGWFVRVLGLIAFLAGVTVLWIYFTGHLPLGLGDQ